MTTYAFYYSDESGVWVCEYEGVVVATQATAPEIAQDVLAFMHLDAVTGTATDNYIVDDE